MQADNNVINRVKNFILYGGTDKDSYGAIKPRIYNYNRIMGLIFGCLGTILITVMFILSKSQEGLKSSRTIYLTGIIFSVIILIVSILAKWMPIMSHVSVHMAISVFLAYGIAIATLTRPDDQTVTFMVLLIFVPLIFVAKPINVAINLIIFIITFIILALRTKSGAVLSADITDAVIFGILSLVSESVVNSSKIKGYVLEHRLNIMSETDQLTGLNNRNCYETRLSLYPVMYHDSICCIYIDVNGLHELNNTKGHKAGDEMLCFVGDAVRKQFGQRDVYRVGGDEYVAFAIDTSEDEINRRLNEMNDRIIEEGYHIAVGYEFCSHKNSDINKLIVGAESKMYKDKADYYKDKERKR